MNKLILFLLLLVGCKTKQIQPSPPSPLYFANISFGWYFMKDKEHYLMWKNEYGKNKFRNEEEFLGIKDYNFFLKTNIYKMKKRQFFYKNEPIAMTYAYRFSIDNYAYHRVEIFHYTTNGKSYEEVKSEDIYNSEKEIFTTKEFFFDDSLNIDGKFKTYNYETTFKKGTGYWKDFYNEEAIKEEGEVKNNYKVGEWKYYNKNGEIDSLKTYSIKDSVDVRFPHCLFNKNEPCY